jgi:hypothetical protein
VLAAVAPALLVTGALAASSAGPARPPRLTADTPAGCNAPQPEGYMRCLAIVRTPSDRVITPDQSGPPSSALTPADLQSAYKLPSATAGGGQTVAIVDAGDDPTAESDLALDDRGPSPYLYFLWFNHDAQIPASLHATLTGAQFASVTTSYHSGPSPVSVMPSAAAWRPDDFDVGGLDAVSPGPMSVTQYYGPLSPDLDWQLSGYGGLSRPEPRYVGLADASFGQPTHSAVAYNEPLVALGATTPPTDVLQAQPARWYLGWCAACRQGNVFYPIFNLMDGASPATYDGQFGFAPAPCQAEPLVFLRYDAGLSLRRRREHHLANPDRHLRHCRGGSGGGGDDHCGAVGADLGADVAHGGLEPHRQHRVAASFAGLVGQPVHGLHPAGRQHLGLAFQLAALQRLHRRTQRAADVAGPDRQPEHLADDLVDPEARQVVHRADQHPAVRVLTATVITHRLPGHHTARRPFPLSMNQRVPRTAPPTIHDHINTGPGARGRGCADQSLLRSQVIYQRAHDRGA